MKRVPLYLLFVVSALNLTGCSSDTPAASEQVKKEFAGGPMPPDAQKKFQESMKRSHELMQSKVPGGAKP